jgi:hypothetical protein
MAIVASPARWPLLQPRVLHTHFTDGDIYRKGYI